MFDVPAHVTPAEVEKELMTSGLYKRVAIQTRTFIEPTNNNRTVRAPFPFGAASCPRC